MGDLMYKIEKTANGAICIFNSINLKLRVIDDDQLKRVYINYNGYNPLFTMLLGEFSAECKLDSIQLDIKSDIKGCTNSMYAVVPKEKLHLFIKSIYFFIMENNLECMLNEKDISIWGF